MYRKCCRLPLSETNLANTPPPNPLPKSSIRNKSPIGPILAALKCLLPYGFVPANLDSPPIEQGTLANHCTKINTILCSRGFSK